MKTQYYGASTLDGFIADENHSLDWLMQMGDPVETSYPGFIRDVGALAMGAHTYEWVVRYLSQDDTPQPWMYEQPTWVFTHRDLPVHPGADVRFVRGDVRPVHAEMAEVAGGKNVWVVGGGDGRGDDRCGQGGHRSGSGGGIGESVAARPSSAKMLGSIRGNASATQPARPLRRAPAA